MPRAINPLARDAMWYVQHCGWRITHPGGTRYHYFIDPPAVDSQWEIDGNRLYDHGRDGEYVVPSGMTPGDVLAQCIDLLDQTGIIPSRDEQDRIVISRS